MASYFTAGTKKKKKEKTTNTLKKTTKNKQIPWYEQNTNRNGKYLNETLEDRWIE